VRQSYPKGKFEVIVIDDASQMQPTASSECCRKKEPRFVKPDHSLRKTPGHKKKNARKQE